jgi:predicted metal-dependent hydrolase
MKPSKPSKPTFTQSLQSALQLDFFSDLVGALLPLSSTKTEKSTEESSDSSKKPSHNRRKVLIQDQILEYELRRSKRRSIGFLIADEGLRITAPRWVTIVEIEIAIQEKQNWIFTKLREKRERLNKRMQPSIQWEDGAQFPYLGEALILRISTTQRSGIYLNDSITELTVCLPPDANEQQLKDRVQSWLQQEAKRIFNLRLPVYAKKLNVQYKSMSLSSAATRWGSCTSDGKIRLNWRLIHFTPEIIDYVIAHELAHLIEMNHSADFWITVESVFPEYQEVKQKLRQHSTNDLPIF